MRWERKHRSWLKMKRPIRSYVAARIVVCTERRVFPKRATRVPKQGFLSFRDLAFHSMCQAGSSLTCPAPDSG